jgi:hypothetical protein
VRRAASDSDVSLAAPPRPLGSAFGALYQDMAQSVGSKGRMARFVRQALGGTSTGAEAQLLSAFGPLIKGIKEAHHRRAQTEGDGRGPEMFVAESLAKAASRSFEDLRPDARDRLVDAFHGNNGTIAQLRQSRDRLLRSMTALSGDRAEGPLSPRFARAALDHEILNYTISAMEYAVPAKG